MADFIDITHEPPGRALVRGRGEGLVLPFSALSLLRRVLGVWFLRIEASWGLPGEIAYA